MPFGLFNVFTFLCGYIYIVACILTFFYLVPKLIVSSLLCCSNGEVSRWQVVSGRTYLSTLGGSSVNKIVVNKNYNSESNDFDMAMIKLNKPLTVGGKTIGKTKLSKSREAQNVYLNKGKVSKQCYYVAWKTVGLLMSPPCGEVLAMHFIRKVIMHHSIYDGTYCTSDITSTLQLMWFACEMILPSMSITVFSICKSLLIALLLPISWGETCVSATL